MSLDQSTKTAIYTCMGIDENDRLTILSDSSTHNIGLALQNEAIKITDEIHYFNLDEYGPRPLKALPDKIEKSAEESTATFWTTKSLEGELHSVRMPFFKAAVKGGRHAHMVGITEEIFKRGLGGDYEKIAEFTNKIKDIVDDVDTMRITTEKGTDLKVDVGKYKWIASTGLLHDIGKWHNLPDGEVFTAPQGMEGVMIVDGTLGDYFDVEYPLEHTLKYPLKIELENKDGKPTIVDIDCEDGKLKKEFFDYVNQSENSDIVGELGLGTNLFVDGLMGNMLMDEKYPGIHIAFGDPNGPMTGAEWSCKTHIDVVIRECNIWAGERKIMEKGKYLI